MNNIECVDNFTDVHKSVHPKIEIASGMTSVTSDVCVNKSHPELVDSQPDMCAGEESSELEFTRCWEFVYTGTQITDVQGQLLKHVTFWEQELHAPPPVIEWIKEGYKFPHQSHNYVKCNHRSALADSEFVDNAIEDLANNKCILEMGEIPHICSPLSVVTNSAGKKRLVIDLRYLNQHLLKEKFKYEDFLFSFDLKSGYHHVDIYKNHWKYLGFAWDNGTGVKYFVFKVLPFGLATACYIFTKLLQHPLIKHWCYQGLRVIIYLDDGIVAVQGREAAEAASAKVQSELWQAGLVEHPKKCNWTPVQCLMWLGFNIDLEKGVIGVPQPKIEAIHSQLEEAMAARVLPARFLASITGKLISMSIALGPVTRLMTRSLHALINTRQSWCQTLVVSPEANAELQFWASQLENFNGQNIWHSPSAIRLVYTEASDTGYGG